MLSTVSGDIMSYFEGNGDGTFDTVVEFPTGLDPQNMVAGDFNEDGDLDVMISNLRDETVSPMMGTGDGNFNIATTKSSSVGLRMFNLATGDFDVDGPDDVVVPIWNGSAVQIHLSNGDGTFAAPASYAMAGASLAVTAADLNGDNAPDVVEANGSVDQLSIRLNNGDGTFGAETNLNTGGYPAWVAAGLINGDSFMDLAVANRDDDDVSIFLGDGTGAFGAPTDFAVGNQPESLVLGDMNGDTNLDLAVVNRADDDISVLLGDGTGSFGAATDFSVGGSYDPTAVATIDFDGDGALDLVTANYHTSAAAQSSISVLPGVGNGTFGAATQIQVGINAYHVIVDDFDFDEVPDVAVICDARFSWGATVYVLTGKGDGTFHPLSGYFLGTGVYEGRTFAGGSGDFNDDSRRDIVVGSYTEQTIRVLLNVGPDRSPRGTLITVR